MQKYIKILVLVVSAICLNHSYASGVSEWLPLEINRGHMIIDIEINGVPTKAMLDTGAENNGISRAFLEKNKIAHKQGYPIVLKGVYGEQKTHSVDGLELGLIGVDIPFNDLIPFAGNDRFDVILGMPLFHAFVFQFDYPQSRMRIASREAINIKEAANVSMKGNKSRSRLVVTVNIDGYDTDLLFDTGNSGGILLNRPFAERKGWIEKYKKLEATSSGVIKNAVSIDVLTLPEMSFGPYTLEDVLVSIPEKNFSKNLKSKRRGGERFRTTVDYKGILGYDVLKHFVVTLDARKAKLHIGAQ